MPEKATSVLKRASKRSLGRLAKMAMLTRWTLGVGGLAAAFTLLNYLGISVGDWATLFRLSFYVLALVFVLRRLHSVWQRLTWSVRNRLLFVYLFISIVPVALLLAMFALAAFLFYGQFAADLVTDRVTGELERASSIAHIEAELHKSGRSAPPQPIGSPDYRAYFYSSAGTALTAGAPALPSWLKPAFSGLIKDSAEISIAVSVPLPEGGRVLVLRSVDRSLMDEFAHELGTIQSFHFGSSKLIPAGQVDSTRKTQTAHNSSKPASTADVAAAIANGSPPTASGRSPRGVATPAGGGPRSVHPDRHTTERIIEGNDGGVYVSSDAGEHWRYLSTSASLPRSAGWFDIAIHFPLLLRIYRWRDGDQQVLALNIASRPSLLNRQLFASEGIGAAGEVARWPIWALTAAGIVLLIIAIISRLIGARMSRAITRAIADLYAGTQHINRGEFGYRIPVRSADQLAALEVSFNAMADSIENLLGEQRQKQRLEDELSIALEVQQQLFPTVVPDVRGIEVFGRCLPARVVSGDYYDFFSISAASGGAEREKSLVRECHGSRAGSKEQTPSVAVEPAPVSSDGRALGVTVGDISGKGISAALLMATIASAVRAHQLDGVAGAPSAGRAGSDSDALAARGSGSTSALMASLNTQLFHSTPPEKYATLFYGIFDPISQRLRYTNAGHLPPALLSAGGVHRLHRGGMVIGLFDGVPYEQDEIAFADGDLFVSWSDGVTEPENEYGVEFGEARLLSIVESNRHRPLGGIADAVFAAVRDWTGDVEQADDMTLVLARVQSVADTA
jgi:sigma-B regulation protein RsbU (phosphoserine phosphatase)